MKKVTKEELNKKDDWIVTSLIHERYTFDIVTMIYRNKTIMEILDEEAYWGLENKIEKYENRNSYAIDEIYHEDPDSDTWCLTEEEKKRFLPLHVQSLMMMPLSEFLENEYLSGVFGATNRKYGVMDYAEYPANMEDNKDEKNISNN